MDSHSVRIVQCTVVPGIQLVFCVLLYLNLITARVPKQRSRRGHTIHAHIPPPPPASTREPDVLAFRNSTEKPFGPTIEVGSRLWELIGGESWELTSGIHTPEKKPIGATAMLAANYLRFPPNNAEHIERVEELLKETKSIAHNCLAKNDGTYGRYFEPHVVRELQLVKYLDGLVEVYVNGEACQGILLTYTETRIPNEPLEEHLYGLTIHLHKPRDGLSVIYHTISSRSWFKGAAEIKLLKEAVVDLTGALASLKGARD
ncbi:hypothetical protein K469DRAFT_684027 [Zopfia rhizophila CBS 207.26]|uniref:Uncharacterized protein n=1 Tax=Zopfia rhizophila CBS 207.26 TaxID=1314779 RepID=A0A6A6D779_9PEZI|nr:hypothetical protein K469DRAFT_684027 [Zopfia rhizophila CBS 207.26]